MKLALVGCSNGQKLTYKGKIDKLINILNSIGISSVLSDCIYEKEDIFSGTALERATALMKMYEDDSITHIFDISGGDVANGVLPYLDYDMIGDSNKTFWGYSDLTTVINAIYAKTGKASVLYQIRNLIYDHSEEQIANFKDTVLDGGKSLFDIKVDFLQGKEMEGIVIGGNIRCFLKLAGTEYMPDFQDKILLLEGYSGEVGSMETCLCQLKQLGAFHKVNGILLGTFTKMEADGWEPSMEILVKRIVGENLPVAKTRDIGHGTDSKGIMIGQYARYSS